MKKSAFILLIIICGVLVAVTAGTPSITTSHPLVVASWLTAILAISVFAIMMVQYRLYERRIYLILGAMYLSIGIMGIRESLIFPPGLGMPSPKSGFLPLWELGWFTMAGALLWGMTIDQSFKGEQSHPLTMVYTASIAVVWASLMILLSGMFPFALYKVFSGTPGLIIGALLCCVFVVSALIYSRYPMHRNNNVIIWTAYGLIFAALSQIALFANIQYIKGFQFGVASILKLLTFMMPAAGMLAEHSRLQSRLHQQSADMNYLIQMQEAAATITSSQDLYRRIVELVSFAFSAGAVCLMSYDEERSLLYVAGRIGFDDEVTKRLVFRPGEAKIGECFSRKEIIFTRDVFDDSAMAQKLYGVTGIGAAVFVPLMIRGSCLGVLAVFFGGHEQSMQKLPKDQIKILEAMATQAAIALNLHQMKGKMASTIKASEDHTRELEIVAEIGRTIASELDIDTLVDTIADSLRSAIGARTCSILVYDPDDIGIRIMGRRKLTRHTSISDHTDLCEIQAAEVAQTNEPRIMNNIPNSLNCKYPEMNVDDGGTHHMISVPMRLPGFYGAINAFRQNAEPFGEVEERIMMRLAPIVAVSIRNAELYQRERKIAESLQQSFLPNLDRDQADIEVQSCYLAAFDESLVGGDFYDIIDFGESRYGIVIGDVAGKGLDAAIYTAMTRYMIEAYSYDNPDPMYVISKLNYALCNYTPVGKFVTVIYGMLDTKAGTFNYVNAGHEIPFILRNNNNQLEALKSTGPAVGALLEAEYCVEKIPFNQGDAVIMYTDGATDARHGDKFLDIDGLYSMIMEQVQARQGDISGLANAILNSINDYSNGYLRDDVAILIVKSKLTSTLF